MVKKRRGVYEKEKSSGYIFRTDGSLVPRRLFCHGNSYPIDRVLGVQPFCPTGIGCIAPLRYTVEVGGYVKEIYFEAETRTWFSVKEDS